MKITATTDDGDGVTPRARLECTPFWGKRYTVYAFFFRGRWFLPSGRVVSRKMLNAIDRLHDLTIRTIT